MLRGHCPQSKPCPKKSFDVHQLTHDITFLGKDSIRYHNLVSVEKRVFRNVGRFMENKKGADDLFDRLNTSILNEYLNGLIDDKD